jgi:hypothetical protein
MQEYVEIRTADGRSVPFAVDGLDAPIPAGRIVDTVKGHAEATLESGVDIVKTVAKAVADKVASLAERPDKVAVEIGLAVTSTAAIVVAKSSTQAHVKVTLEWESDKQLTPATPAGPASPTS